MVPPSHWKGGKKNGQGTKTWADGLCRHGEGTLIYTKATSMLEHGRMIKNTGKEHILMLMVQAGPGNGRTTNKKNEHLCVVYMCTKIVHLYTCVHVFE